jgi:hypothetical protein
MARFPFVSAVASGKCVYFFFAYILVASSWNACAFIICASNVKRFYESPAAFFCLSYLLLAGIVVVPAAVVIWLVWRAFRNVGPVVEPSRFFALWAAMLVPLNARAYGHAVPPRKETPQYAFAWPGSESCWYLTFLWGGACVLQHFYIPSELPRNSKAWAGLLAFVLTFSTVVWFMLWDVLVTKETGNGVALLLSDTAAKAMPIMSLLMTEILRFLHTSNGHSVEALGLILLVMNLAENLVWCGFSGWGVRGTLWNLLTLLIGIACRVASTLGGERPSSTEPRFRPNPSEVFSMRTFITILLQFSSSFRGKMWLFLGNSIYSLAFYSWEAQPLKDALRPWPDWHPCNTASLVDCTIWFSFAAIIVCIVSLLGDMELPDWISCARWVRMLHAWIPVDRNLRCITLLKAAMLYFKFDVFLFTRKQNDLSVFEKSAQVLTILFTVLVTTWSTMTATIRAVRPESDSAVRWRLGKTFRWSCFLTACMFQALTVTVLVSETLRLPVFLNIMQSLDVGIGVNVPDPYVFALLPFMNEMSNTLSTSAERQTHFHRVQSPVCLQTLAAICAVKLPLHALNDWVYDKRTLRWGYIKVLLSGTDAGGPDRWLGGWLPPVVTYMTLGLVGLAALASWTGGSQQGRVFE